MDINNRLILPYESHLSDIVDITKWIQEPSHTTPNSIRHILETICGFESPNKHIEKFISEKEKLSDTGHIYSLMHDLSHGKPRKEPLTVENIKIACNIVVDYISDAYPEQIL